MTTPPTVPRPPHAVYALESYIGHLYDTVSALNSLSDLLEAYVPLSLEDHKGLAALVGTLARDLAANVTSLENQFERVLDCWRPATPVE